MRKALLGLFVGAACSLGLACDDDEPTTAASLTCGAGTVERRGTCLAQTTAGAPSSAGALTCGPGTLEVDGRCVAELTCGDGTHPEDGECVVDDVGPECWAGTTLVGGACVPDASVCQQGTSFDEANGRCELDPSACGLGTVYLGGSCLPEDAALEADFIELPEPNDGAVAGEFGAPALGLGVTLHGCITPRDGEADRDVWRIHASEPALLDITADGVGGLAAAFAVTAENVPALAHYERLGFALKNDTARRQVYLPAAGDYLLLMSSTLGLLHDSPSGVPETCYFTTLERVALPPAAELLLPELTTSSDGNVSVFRYLTAEEGRHLELSLTASSPRVGPAFVVLQNGSFFGASTANDDTATLTVDDLASGDVVDVIVDFHRDLSGAEGAILRTTVTSPSR